MEHNLSPSSAVDAPLPGCAVPAVQWHLPPVQEPPTFTCLPAISPPTPAAANQDKKARFDATMKVRKLFGLTLIVHCSHTHTHESTHTRKHTQACTRVVSSTVLLRLTFMDNLIYICILDDLEIMDQIHVSDISVSLSLSLSTQDHHSEHHCPNIPVSRAHRRTFLPWNHTHPRISTLLFQRMHAHRPLSFNQASGLHLKCRLAVTESDQCI